MGFNTISRTNPELCPEFFRLLTFSAVHFYPTAFRKHVLSRRLISSHPLYFTLCVCSAYCLLLPAYCKSKYRQDATMRSSIALSNARRYLRRSARGNHHAPHLKCLVWKEHNYMYSYLGGVFRSHAPHLSISHPRTFRYLRDGWLRYALFV